MGFIPVVGGYGPGPGFGMPASSGVSPLFERIQRLNAEGALRRQAAQQADAGPGQPNEKTAPGAGASRAESSAERGDLSVAEIRRRQAEEEDSADEELAGWIERARGAEAAGKRNVARIYYRMAASRATATARWMIGFSSVGSAQADTVFYLEGQYGGFGFSYRFVDTDDVRLSRVIADSMRSS